MGTVEANSEDPDVKEVFRNVLKLSFDRLPDVSQKIFLDIATVCANQKRDLLLAAWDDIYKNSRANPGLCLDALINASLITTTERRGSFAAIDECRVEIHDLLRDLGRTLVVEAADASETAPWTHLWTPKSFEVFGATDMVSYICKTLVIVFHSYIPVIQSKCIELL